MISIVKKHTDGECYTSIQSDALKGTNFKKFFKNLLTKLWILEFGAANPLVGLKRKK